MLWCSSPFRAFRATRLGALAVSAALAAGCQHGSDPLASTTSPDARTLAKKGVGTWSFAGGSRAMADVGVSWFYTWRVDHQWEPAPPGVEFVPMIWDETHANADEIAQAVATGTDVLLGYNEPDSAGQANMTVAKALDLWPLLEGTGMRLGSPAMAGDPSVPGSWLERFMAGAVARSYRVDFVCVHWYGSGADPAAETARLERFLRAAYQKYQKPLWLTEFALANWETVPPTFPAYDRQAAFLRQAVPMLESLPFLERYAWFSLPPWAFGGVLATTNLYDDAGSPTAAGEAYRSLPAAREADPAPGAEAVQ